MKGNETAETAEAERLEALQRYGVLDSASEQSYDDITELAAFICDAPISLISFVDETRQWFKSELGLGVRETPRSQSFCAHTIPMGRTLVVSDARADVRFEKNPLVLGDPGIRFYAGAPIIEKDGKVLGTVCVIDSKPRTLSAKQISALEALARQVVILLEQRQAIGALRHAMAEAKAADKLVKESEDRLRTFVESLPVLAWIANADGWITWYNRRWYDYTGTTPKQMEGWGWQSVHDAAVLPDVMARWTASIRTGEPFEMVFPLRGADGVLRPFQTRIEPLRNEFGEIQNWFGTNAEVEAMQKIQHALERSQATLTQVLTATTDAVLMVDTTWTVRYLNMKAEELYNVTQEIIGKNVWEALPATSDAGLQFRESYEQAMFRKSAEKFEAVFGPPLNYIVGAEVYPSDDGIVVFSRDITKFKNAAAAVLQSEKLAAVGRLASSIAHEINNPLEAVTNLIFLASTSEDLETSRQYLGHADMELRRVAAIANHTLRFHRQTTKATVITFAGLTENIFRGFHSRMRNSKIEAMVRDRTTLPVLCLEGEIRQVLVNLIGNAIDAMHGRGGVLHLRGEDGTDWKTGRTGMVITIADTGEGMSERTREKVFEAFYTTKGIGGTGLGLWVSSEIVQRHHGRLQLRSSQKADSSGAVFRLFLPAEAA